MKKQNAINLATKWVSMSTDDTTIKEIMNKIKNNYYSSDELKEIRDFLGKMSVTNRLNNPALSQAAHAGAWAVLVVIVPEENQLALYQALETCGWQASTAADLAGKTEEDKIIREGIHNLE